MSRERRLEDLLSEGLDLCVRARKMDAIDRREATLGASIDPKAWQENGLFDRHVARNNIENPDKPISTRSGTLPLWTQEQYDKDVADWERRARAFLLHPKASDVLSGDEAMRALSASEAACYEWPEDTPEHQALRAAFVKGSLSGGVITSGVKP